MTVDPLFILAADYARARATAMDLDLPPSRTGAFWRWVDDAHAFRGRRMVRVCRGYGWYDHPRSREFDFILREFETRLPGSVEYVSVGVVES